MIVKKTYDRTILANAVILQQFLKELVIDQDDISNEILVKVVQDFLK